MGFPEQLQTERLLLRPAMEADATAIFARYGQDREVCRYLSWRPHRSIDDTLEFLRRIVSQNAQGASAGYLIFRRHGGPLLGTVGGRIEDSRIQFGYCLARDAWGQGFATEATSAFVATALEQPRIWRVQAYCDLENGRSARVLEKAGLRQEGVLRRFMVLPNLDDVPRDVWLYAKVRGDTP